MEYLVYYNNGEFKYREGEHRYVESTRQHVFECTDGKRPSYLADINPKYMMPDRFNRVLISDLIFYNAVKVIILDAMLAKNDEKIDNLKADLKKAEQAVKDLQNYKKDILQKGVGGE